MYKAYIKKLQEMVPRDNMKEYLGYVFDVWHTVLTYISEERSLNLICILRIPIEMGFVVNTSIGMVLSGLGMLKVILDSKFKNQ